MLVLIFHLFLFKLIYNEYCASPDRHFPSRYTLWLWIFSRASFVSSVWWWIILLSKPSHCRCHHIWAINSSVRHFYTDFILINYPCIEKHWWCSTLASSRHYKKVASYFALQYQYFEQHKLLNIFATFEMFTSIQVLFCSLKLLIKNPTYAVWMKIPARADTSRNFELCWSGCTSIKSWF